MCSSLNAPFGARCFLTLPKPGPIEPLISGLNAPSGARCFLTPYQLVSEGTHFCVLMHLLALGASDPQCVVAHGNTWLQSQCAFWRSVLSDLIDWLVPRGWLRYGVLMHLLALGAF